MSRPADGDYVNAALEIYRRLGGTAADPRRADRQIAATLHRRGVSLATLEAALLLARARRAARPATAAPLAPIRSLHYFVPLIEEITNSPLADRYAAYLIARYETLSNRNPATVQISTVSDDR